ncbi:hypothetical protein AAFP32_12080 [Brevibacterium sp. CBA3109]|uniref:Uncharacterized protein n=1 Tax=Brevibacterium koreense TaxID=3140787 RepID=A0AAU7UIJ9_9MICO
MNEIQEVLTSSPVLGGLAGGLITAILAFAGGIFQRSHDRKLSRYDRGFEVKLGRYDAYSNAANEIISAITEMHEDENPDVFGPMQNPDVPRTVAKAYFDLQVVAPLDIRNDAISQFSVMQAAMEGDFTQLQTLRGMHNDLLLDMQHDLDLNRKSLFTRPVLLLRRILRSKNVSTASSGRSLREKKKMHEMNSRDLSKEGDSANDSDQEG